MRVLLPAILLGLALSMLPAPLRAWETGGWEAGACLQRQLNALGYGPLAEDGRIGPATREALARYETDFGTVPARPLAAATAVIHCRQLGLRHSDTRTMWPSRDTGFRVLAEDDVPERHLNAAQDAMSKGMVFLKDVLGLELAGAPVLILGHDPRAIRRLAGPYLAPGFSDAGLARDLQGTCAGPGLRSLSNPGLIIACYPGDDDWKARPLWAELAPAVAYAMVNEAQWQLAGLPSASGEEQILAEKGPYWLIIGSAMTLTDLYMSVDRANWYLAKIRELPPDTSRDLREAESGADGRALGEAVFGLGGGAAAQLALREGGPKALLAFYEALGAGLPWPEAFTNAFGLTPEDFYDAWDALVRTP